jgi:hypothetical protein
VHPAVDLRFEAILGRPRCSFRLLAVVASGTKTVPLRMESSSSKRVERNDLKPASSPFPLCFSLST